MVRGFEYFFIAYSFCFKFAFSLYVCFGCRYVVRFLYSELYIYFFFARFTVAVSFSIISSRSPMASILRRELWFVFICVLIWSVL